MRDYISIGSTPASEDCLQVGKPECTPINQKKECQAFLEAIRKKLGPEPAGASLVTKGFDHDFGRYFEVVCYYDDALPESEAYAYKCEGESPQTWAEVGMTTPQFN
jgi:hypothetical protein